jgi:rhamnose transport system substrate-binding protein
MRRSLKRALWAPAVLLVAASVLAACSSSGSSSSSSSSAPAAASGGLKKGLKVFVIPKNLGNPYFTTADSTKTGGALAALSALGATGAETSGTQATPASQIPAIQAAISKGANALVVSATDPSALCPTLNGAMAKGITVVTYDSDAPTCRNLFVNQASTAQIGTSEVDLLAKQMNNTGDIAIVSAAASATNQNAWIRVHEAGAEEVPEDAPGQHRLRQRRPHHRDPGHPGAAAVAPPTSKGIISPTTVASGRGPGP